jgi:N-acetylglucosamine kinase-like BadF-type ATPase
LRYVIGIDAGGTKTVALLADETGQVLAEARGGGANLQTHGELEVEKVFDEVMDSVRGDRTISAVGLGIAGVDRPHDEAVVRAILRRLGHRETAVVVNDAAIALVAGAPERVGIVVLAGTGSIAYGADRTGKTARSGGFGFLLADEGSGYWLGHQALRAVVRASDGRGPETRITPVLFEELDVSSIDELVPRVYEKGLPKHRIAALAGVVQRAHELGDEVASRLIEAGARELALAARAVARQLDLGDGPFPVVLAGGAFKACPAMVDPLVREIGLPGARPALLERDPAHGAVRLALDLLK